MNWLTSQEADFYAQGVKNLVHQYKKCLQKNGEYAEKLS